MFCNVIILLSFYKGGKLQTLEQKE